MLGGAIIYSYYKFVQGLFKFHCVVNIFKILGGAWPPWPPCRSATAQQSSHDHCVYRYYGCGPVFPKAVEGCRVVDLGSGAGRDCFLLSKMVGSTGFVTGVDMTPELVCLLVIDLLILYCSLRWRENTLTTTWNNLNTVLLIFPS